MINVRFGHSNLIEAFILLVSMGLLNRQIQDMNSYLGYERLFLDSCELVFTGLWFRLYAFFG